MRVLSGKDGKVLMQYEDGLDHYVGMRVAAAGDVDGDGVGDFYAAGWAYPLHLVSGKTGKLLRLIGVPAAVAGEFSGDADFANLGDVDADGVPDLGWGSSRTTPTERNTGMFLVISNKTNTLLYTYVGKEHDYMGSAILGFGDVDGDGHVDFGVSVAQAHTGSTKTGYYVGYSGKTGAEMFRIHGEHPNQAFGTDAALLGDLNGDGWPEIAISSQWPKNSNNTWGRTEVFSMVDLPLTAYPTALSLRQAGYQTLHLDAGSGQANQNYWMFGSVTGVTPGTKLPGIDIPLNYDAYTEFTIGSSGGAYLTRFRGVLDGAGEAYAAFHVPAGLPALMDFTLYHAAVIFDQNGVIRQVTNPVTLRLGN